MKHRYLSWNTDLTKMLVMANSSASLNANIEDLLFLEPNLELLLEEGLIGIRNLLASADVYLLFVYTKCIYCAHTLLYNVLLHVSPGMWQMRWDMCTTFYISTFILLYDTYDFSLQVSGNKIIILAKAMRILPANHICKLIS